MNIKSGFYVGPYVVICNNYTKFGTCIMYFGFQNVDLIFVKGINERISYIDAHFTLIRESILC
jgi:hypothetical protein